MTMLCTIWCNTHRDKTCNQIMCTCIQLSCSCYNSYVLIFSMTTPPICLRHIVETKTTIKIHLFNDNINWCMLLFVTSFFPLKKYFTQETRITYNWQCFVCDFCCYWCHLLLALLLQFFVVSALLYVSSDAPWLYRYHPSRSTLAPKSLSSLIFSPPPSSIPRTHSSYTLAYIYFYASLMFLSD